MRYVEDMKKATLAEFDKEEAEWRETAERQVLHLCEIEEAVELRVLRRLLPAIIAIAIVVALLWFFLQVLRP